MNFCQKCLDASNQAYMDYLDSINGMTETDNLSKPVPESECEFWAHKAINYTILEVTRALEDLETDYQRVGKRRLEALVKGFNESLYRAESQ